MLTNKRLSYNTAMCDQDYSCGNHGKTEVKKTVNHAFVRKGMLDRISVATISGSNLKYTLNRVMQ